MSDREISNQELPESQHQGGEFASYRGYPLGALFILVAACGVLLAMVSPLAKAVVAGTVTPNQLVFAACVGGGLGIVLGFFVGIHHHRRLLGVGIGLGVGLTLGVVIGPITLTPERDFLQLMGGCLTGSVVMLVVASGIHFASQRAVEENAENNVQNLVNHTPNAANAVDSRETDVS